MIKITHFVNPHKFFFKRKKDEDFDKQLDEMEMKIKGTVAKKMQSPDEADEFQIGDIVAVFVSDFNKWVRGAIKAKDSSGLMNVWAIDYGVPIISTKVIKLPPVYEKMNVKFPRVFLGGLINFVPAESSYDFETDSVILLEQPNWSAKAIEITQNVISRAINLKFEEVEEVRLPNGPHLFGYLKVQKADGSWLDLSNCLSNASVAKTTNDNWSSHAHRLETINQREWVTLNGTPLHLLIAVSLCSIEQFSNDNKQQKKCQATPQPNINNKPNNTVVRFDEVQHVATDQQNDFNENLSICHSRVFKRRDTSATRSVKGRHGMIFRGGGNPNYHQLRQSDFNSQSQFPKGWHSNGKLNNQRYREEVEYFESAFRPTITTTKNDESSQKNETKFDGSDLKETGSPVKIESTEMVPLEKVANDVKRTIPDTKKTANSTNVEVLNKDDSEPKLNGNINGDSGQVAVVTEQLNNASIEENKQE